MNDFINETLKAGCEIADILQNKEKFLYKKCSFGAGGDLNIGADLKSEEIFCRYLSKFGNIDSEESGFCDNKKNDVIILDPLDGSDNFISNIPYYGASVALCDRDLNAKIGIIINFCDKKVIVNNGKNNFKGNLEDDFKDFKIANLQKGLVKCGIFERAYSNPEICKILKENNIKFRSLGALALSLGISNEVNFVIFAGEARKYDIKAGLLISKNLYKIEDKNLLLIAKDKDLFDNISKLLFS